MGAARIAGSRALIVALGAALVLVARVAPAVAWGGAGHRIIAAAAMTHLAAVSPETARAVTRILGRRSVVYAATWPDTLRGIPEYAHTLPWHFVDIPVDAPGYDAARDCRVRTGARCDAGRDPACGDCVVAAIARAERTLRDPDARATARREALMFLIHLIGDLHQPLHCADDGDHGGNAKRVCFFGGCWSTHGGDAGEDANLHGAWDSYMIARRALARRLDDEAYARRIADAIARLSPRALAAREAGTLADWATESHRRAVANAYVLPSRIRKRNPYERAWHYYYPLGEAYFDHNIAVVEDQMMAAAIRLAKVLRETLH